MFCPHCENDGISFWSKLVSGPATPARCKLCGKSSSTSGFLLGATGFLFHIAFLGAAIASFFYWSWWPLTIAALTFILFNIFLTKWAPLKAMTEAQVKKEKVLAYVFIGALVLLVILAGVYIEWRL